MAMALQLSVSLPATRRLPHQRPSADGAPSCHASVSGSSGKTLPKSHLRLPAFWKREGGERVDWRRSAASFMKMEGILVAAEATLRPLEEAARKTVDYFVKSGMAVGLGTGRASDLAIAYIGQKLRSGVLRDIVGVPMSSASAAAAAQAGVPLVTFEDQPELDIAFDDADSVQEGTLFAIIGRKGVEGRQSILKEKAMMKAAKQMVFIIEEKQFVGTLDGSVPVLIQQEDWIDVAEEIDDLFLGDAEVWRRPSSGEAGPLGGDNPLVTPEGHYVLDVIFTTPIKTAAEVVENLETIDGVMGHGLVMDTAYAAAIAGPGGVKIRTSLFKTAFTSME